MEISGVPELQHAMDRLYKMLLEMAMVPAPPDN